MLEKAIAEYNARISKLGNSPDKKSGKKFKKNQTPSNNIKMTLTKSSEN